MRELHCLYCEKPISMLGRLTDKEFCSKEHRQIYQREHSQLALARLIEADETEDRKRGRGRSKGSTRERIIPLPVVEPPPPPLAPHLSLVLTGEVGLAGEKAPSYPRWRPMLARPAVPDGASGAFIAVAGSFLYRDPVIAVNEFSRGADRKRIRAITFPRIAPRMRYLEECLRRTDRLGFCPP